MDPWQRERVLARLTAGWAVVSVASGLALATRADPWWRAFGQQHVGWGAIDLGLVAVATPLQTRRMRRAGNPYHPTALDRERRWLRKVLLVNVVADAGYVALGTALWRRRPSPRAAGAGAAIVIQGAFLLLHDAHHASRLGA